MEFSSTGLHKVQSVSSCLLFDPRDGSIRHLHRVVTIEGAAPTSKAELEAQTLAEAKRLGLPAEQLQVLHVDEEALAEPARYSVDLTTRKLVKGKQLAHAGMPGLGVNGRA
ncbi:MAG: hypothetical protein ACRC20_09355 [Segniliparus sp.]|uniref:hypothetical protein n=1 Tax=Segniliparus sp. TaxID=2804064 RepID=UPI003F39617D